MPTIRVDENRPIMWTTSKYTPVEIPIDFKTSDISSDDESEIEVPLVPYLVNKRCEKCGKGFMNYSIDIGTHICSSCGYKKSYYNTYPYIKYKCL